MTHIDQPVLTPVRDAHRFDEAALNQYLSRELSDFGGGLTVEQYEGGSSNPTFLLRTDAGQWVMRKRPPGQLLDSAHQIDREYRVMHALRDTDVPVPRVHLFCEDPEIVGQQFYVMEMIPGRVTTSELPNLTPQERTAFYEDFLRVLAALHQVDHVAVGLEKHGRPGNYFARQIDRWSKQYAASKTEDIPEMDRLIEWMPNNIPDGDEVGIIHGDYRVGNILLHPTEPKVAAVLDWELSTLGHPMGDLAYHASYTYHAEFDPFFDELSERGIPSEEWWRNRYCELTGRDEITNWNFYTAYNLFRLAAIIQGVLKRVIMGNVSSHYDVDEERERVVTRARKAWALVESMT